MATLIEDIAAFYLQLAAKHGELNTRAAQELLEELETFKEEDADILEQIEMFYNVLMSFTKFFHLNGILNMEQELIVKELFPRVKDALIQALLAYEL